MNRLTTVLLMGMTCAAFVKATDGIDEKGRGEGFTSPRRVVTVTCVSSANSQNRCSPQGIIYRVELVTEISSSVCKEGENWGVNPGSVWVSKGCSAVFRVVLDERYRHGLDGSLYMTLHCASPTDLFEVCPAPGRILKARLLRQNSAANCVLHRNWGYRRDLLWVDAGCSGLFEVNIAPRSID